MSILVHLGICPVCGQQGIQRAVELLPKTGTLMKIRHPDGKEHRWAEYDSIYDVAHQPKGNKTIIRCPKCNKKGRINHYHPKKRHTEIVLFLVVHEQIEGKWCKQQMSKRRRCYLHKEHRDDILKKLGRYIRH
jgi:predicted RNA-binding Zn-ribbon protein involved in translation (DUF1610 family)